VRYLQGEWPLEKAVSEIRRQSRTLVRHQSNWFRPDDPSIEWHLSQPGVEDELVDRITRRLASST